METHLHPSGRTTWEMSMRLPGDREAKPFDAFSFEGVCSLWLTWVSSHASESLLVDARPQLEEEERTLHSRRLVGRKKGYHKLNNIICRLLFGRLCQTLNGSSGDCGLRGNTHHQDHQN